jgi:hypothetical protein
MLSRSLLSPTFHGRSGLDTGPNFTVHPSQVYSRLPSFPGKLFD